MQFKIKNTEYKISFSFFALLLLLLTLADNHLYFICILSAFVHELVHLFFIYKFSSAPKKVSFTLFGADIVRGVLTHSETKYEVLINVSAPIFNILIGLFFLLFYKWFKGQMLVNISIINFSLGIFNLIPFYNFDGGNALRCILLKATNERWAEIILMVVSIIVTVIFSFFSVYIFYNFQHNITLVFVSVYMILSILFKK